MTDEPIIWVVDDDPSVRRSLVRLIRSAGIRARDFASAREFLDADPAGRGCILLDLHMPDINGMEMLEQLAGGARARPVILLSGNADMATISSALGHGAFGFLVKPVEDEELLGSIRTAIDSIRSEAAR